MIVDREQVAAGLPELVVGPPIGSGPRGPVFVATDRVTGAARAVKALPVPASGTSLGAPDHPHVVPVVEHTTSGGLWLVVSELMAGGSLDEQRHPTPEAVCAWALAAASALAAAHGAGLVHGGITATNLLLDAEGALKVSDFGYAVLGSDVDPEPADDVSALATVLDRLLAAVDEPLPEVAAVLGDMRDDEPRARPSAEACVSRLAAAAASDLGPDWPWRSGVPLRIVPARGRGFGAGPPRPSGAGSRRPDDAAGSWRPDDAAGSWRPDDAAGSWRPGVGAGFPRSGAAGSPGGSAPRLGRRRVAVAAGCALVLAAIGAGVRLVDVGAPPSPSAPAVERALAPKPTDASAIYHGAPGTATRLAYGSVSDRVAFLDATGSLYVWTPGQVWAPGRPDAVGPIGAASAFDDVRFDEGGSGVITAGSDGTVRVWSPDTGRLSYGPLPGLDRGVVALAETGQGAVVAVADATGIRIDRDETFVGKAAIPGVRVAERGLRFSPDGRTLAAAGPAGVQLWEVATGALRTPVTGATGHTAPVFSPDGRRLAAASGPETVRVWDLGTGRPVGPDLPVGELSTDSAITFDEYGEQLVTAVDRTVTRWNPVTGATGGDTRALSTGATPGSAAFNRDATRLAVAFDDGTVRVFALR
ncbi:protein kinase domain-containing protein [Cryptosporangium japonicum]|uniref:Protein kinase domain-containing protein n=1 Tax=Cryptosporangium japonicum TaxID=80872 RepID=A0ABN0V0Z8_9ACTN